MSCSREAFCKALDDRIEGTNEKRKGFQSVEVVNLAEVKTETIGVAYRLSAKDKGLMLNFCPFCGEKILWRKDPVAQRQGGQP